MSFFSAVYGNQYFRTTETIHWSSHATKSPPKLNRVKLRSLRTELAETSVPLGAGVSATRAFDVVVVATVDVAALVVVGVVEVLEVVGVVDVVVGSHVVVGTCNVVVGIETCQVVVG